MIRAARFCGRIVRTQMNYPKLTQANKHVATDKCRNLMLDQGWTLSQIVTQLPVAVIFVFLITTAEMRAKDIETSIETMTHCHRAEKRPLTIHGMMLDAIPGAFTHNLP